MASVVGQFPVGLSGRSKRSLGVASVRCHRGCVGWTVMGYGSANNTEYFAKYHIIWCPKYRRRVLGGAGEDRLGQLVGGTQLDVVRRHVENQYVENQKTAA